MSKKIKPKLGRSFSAIIDDDTQTSHKKIIKTYMASKGPDKKIATKQKAPPPVETKKPKLAKTFALPKKRVPGTVKTKIPELRPIKQPEAIPKIFTDFYSIIQGQENVVDVIKIIGADKFDLESVFKQYKSKGFESLHDTFMQDDSEGKKVFNQILKEETNAGIGLLKELNNIIKKKHSEEEINYRDLLKKKKELYSLWSNLAEEKESLQDENKKMTVGLDEFLEKKRWLTSKREYINYKYSEYGDDDKINELFEQWSEEHKNARAEEESLNAEYKKSQQDVKTLPRLCNDIKNEIKNRQDEMALAKYEVQEILKVYPDLEERAKESQDIVEKYSAVHKDLEGKIKTVIDLKEKFKQVDSESKVLENRLSIKKKEIEPFLNTQNSLKNKLAEITNKFNLQEEITEEKRLLNETVKPLEKGIEEWKKKINNYETKTAEMNKEIEILKEEKLKVAPELKELEALIGPAKELKEKLTSAEKEISQTEEQDKQLTKAIHKTRKENEILSIKAKQFEMIKKKLEGIK